MLHILLRVIAHLYWHTCQKHCMSPESIEKLHEFMKAELGVTVNSEKRLTKNQDHASIGKRKESFIGAECLLLLEQYPALLDFMYDTQLQGKLPEEKEKARKAWKKFDDLWKLVTTCRLPVLKVHTGENGPRSLPSLAARKERAKLVQAVADKFVDAFVTAAGLQAHVTVYMHVIKCHLRQFVELYGNLMDYSAQGSEHCHVLTKYAFKNQTNKKKDQRVEQALRSVAMLQHYEKLFPSTKGTGTKRKKSADIQAEDERRDAMIEEVLATAQQDLDEATALRTPDRGTRAEIEEVNDDADDEEAFDGEEVDEDDDGDNEADDVMIC